MLSATENAPDHAVAAPVLGDVADAEIGDLARRRSGDVVVAEHGCAPEVGRPHPGDGLDQLPLTVALDAGDAEDLAGPDREVERPDGLRRPGRRRR